MSGNQQSARDAVLGRIRASLGRGTTDAATAAALDTRINTRPGHTRPAQCGEFVDLFKQRFEARGGTVTRIASREDFPRAVADLLGTLGLPPRIVVGGALAGIVWPQGIEHEVRRAEKTDLVSVSACQLAIAETGSLMFCAGPESPTTHNFVPDYQIVLLDAGTMVCHLEDAWEVLRARGGMPRAVNLVSGPSRTGDIEQTIQLGAHGPRRVFVMVYGTPAA
ncbi:lactate utilization protein C [Uliginosibacterium sp. sgz301328]|uniref:LutC/YkgG family protein n=1 Tax=Uliginosibacterium sp. sgz301328 TaxID=3243764 RepID=UPI00359F05E9